MQRPLFLDCFWASKANYLFSEEKLLLLQAALLSLIPTHLEYITKVEKLTAKALHPLVFWVWFS